VHKIGRKLEELQIILFQPVTEANECCHIFRQQRGESFVHNVTLTS